MKKNCIKFLALTLIVALCAICFTACVPSDFAKAEKNLKDNKYETVVIKDDEAHAVVQMQASSEDIKLTGYCTQIIEAENANEEHITIYYFDNSKDAKAFKEAYKNKYGFYKAMLKTSKKYKQITKAEYEEEMEEFDDISIGSSGKVFWFGTKLAEKACN